MSSAWHWVVSSLLGLLKKLRSSSISIVALISVKPSPFRWPFAKLIPGPLIPPPNPRQAWLSLRTWGIIALEPKAALQFSGLLYESECEMYPYTWTNVSNLYSAIRKGLDLWWRLALQKSGRQRIELTRFLAPLELLTFEELRTLTKFGKIHVSRVLL